MKLGSLIRRHIQEGVGQDAIAGITEAVLPTPDEKRTPWLYKEALAKKRAAARDIEIMDLWEAMVGPVRSTCVGEQDWENTCKLFEMCELHNRTNGRFPLQEAETYANAFILLTQAKLFTTMMATYELTPATYERIFGTFEAPYERFDHHIPSDSPEVSYVKEGQAYPVKSIADRYCKTKANKFGAIIDLTRETMIADKTGRVIEECEGLAASTKYTEDALAALAFRDASNSTLIPDSNEQDAGSYFPEGTRVALFRTAVGSTMVNYEKAINKKTSNNLLQWNNIQAALYLLRNMTNGKGQYINVTGGKPLKLIVPHGLEQRAKMLASPQAIAQIDRNNTAGTESAFLRVPGFLKEMAGQTVEVVVWDKLPTESTDTQSTWYLAGDTQKMYRKHQVWAVEFARADRSQLGGQDFSRDILMRFKGGFKSGFRAVDDKYTIQNTNS